MILFLMCVCVLIPHTLGLSFIPHHPHHIVEFYLLNLIQEIILSYFFSHAFETLQYNEQRRQSSSWVKFFLLVSECIFRVGTRV